MVKVECRINNLVENGRKKAGDIFEVEDIRARQLADCGFVKIIKDEPALIPNNMKAEIPNKKEIGKNKKGGKKK